MHNRSWHVVAAALLLALTPLVTTPDPGRAGATAPQLSGITALGVSQGRGVVFASAAGGLYRANTPPYQRWTLVTTLSSITGTVQGLYPNPTDANDLFLLAAPQPQPPPSSPTLYHSTDGGATLTPQTVCPAHTGTAVTGLAWAVPDGSSVAAGVPRVYAACAGIGDAYVARSDDDGRTWRQVLDVYTFSGDASIPALTIAPGTAGATVLLAEMTYHGGGLQETTDGGATWRAVAAPPVQSGFSAPEYVAISPFSATRVWTWWDGVLWYSSKGGDRWTAANQGLQNTADTARGADIDLQFLPRPSVVFLRLNGYLYRSRPGGGWARLSGVPNLARMVSVWRSGYLVAATRTGALVLLDATHLPLPAPAPLPGKWTATTPAVAVSDGQTATLLPDGTVLVTGGASPSDPRTKHGATAETQLFAPSSGRWRPGPAMHVAREDHTATLLADGRVLVSGGFDHSFHELRSAELYTTLSRRWTALPPMPVARGAHTATRLPNGRVLVAGGRDHRGDTIMPVEIYAPGTGTWVRAGALPRALQSSLGLATAVRLNNGTVLLANPGWTGAVARYAPRTHTWTLDRTSPLAFRTGVMFTTLHDGRTLAAGGETVSNDGLGMLADVFISDAKTATWTAVAPMPLARAWGAALTLRDGRVLVLGGTTKAGPTASAELYDPTTNRWSEAQPMLHAHGSGLTATLLRDGRVLVLGGGRTAGAELFDPATRRHR
jgi:hypothetical protein